MAAEYKKIRVKKEKSLTSKEKNFLNEISDVTDDKNLKIENKDSEVLVFLKKVNLNFLMDLENKNELPENNILKSIINKIKEIKSYSIENDKLVYVNYNQERKVKNRKAKEAERRKHFYTHNHNFSQENNSLPEKYKNRIICADSEDYLKKLPANSIDLIFTSPPYNFGLDYEDHKDHSYWEKYFDKLFAIFKECIRVLKYRGRIIINVQPLFSDYIPSHHIISKFFMEHKLIWKGEILWEKNNYNCKYTAWGSWKSPSSPYLKYTWEFLEVFAKGDMKKPGAKEDIDISADEFKDWVTAKWSIAPEKKMKDYDHPAMFPEELVERVLKLFSYENDVILDPFNGVGTTTYTARKYNRDYLGIDISEEYCISARERLDDVDL
ncbi:MAG: DNA-methyltransferase [Halanaerobiales bacterium]